MRRGSVGQDALVPSPVMAKARGWWPIAVIVLGLVVANVLWNRVATNIAYVPFGLAFTAALLWFTVRVDGRSWTELGLGRAALGRGLRWGGVLLGAMVVIYVIGYALPLTHDLFLDDRVEDLSFVQVAYYALVRVPLGTVLLEEVAFRGVLPAVLGARTRRWVAVAISAGLFGCWHILPSLGLDEVNPVATDTVGTLPAWVTTLGAVGSTAAVGVWLWFLRHRSTSLLVPMALHWATNGFGYLFAYAAWSAV